MVFSAAGFPPVFPEKRLELKSLKRQTKAEEEGPRGLTDFQIFVIVEFFLWSLVAHELGTDPRLGLARTAP